MPGMAGIVQDKTSKLSETTMRSTSFRKALWSIPKNSEQPCRASAPSGFIKHGFTHKDTDKIVSGNHIQGNFTQMFCTLFWLKLTCVVVKPILETIEFCDRFNRSRLLSSHPALQKNQSCQRAFLSLLGITPLLILDVWKHPLLVLGLRVLKVPPQKRCKTWRAVFLGCFHIQL